MSARTDLAAVVARWGAGGLVNDLDGAVKAHGFDGTDPVTAAAVDAGVALGRLLDVLEAAALADRAMVWRDRP